MRKKWIRKLGLTFGTIFIFLNLVAIFHSYRFTHFSNSDGRKTREPGKLSTIEKISTLLLGVNNPRPENVGKPTSDFQTIKLKAGKEIECWRINVKNSKGMVLLFHGYGGEKSSLLDKSQVFNQLGYSTFLVDFIGSGGSEGNQTTIGYFEAEQVKACFDFLSQTADSSLYLFGTSMGAVAIMKAIQDYSIKPSGVIIECPFGSMYQTVCARFRNLNVPVFPMAGLLVLWGGVQNGFWAFSHNPVSYASEIYCPTLLLYGAKDEKVSRGEIDAIFNKIKGKKELKIYPDAGHENYLSAFKEQWTSDVREFLRSTRIRPS